MQSNSRRLRASVLRSLLLILVFTGSACHAKDDAASTPTAFPSAFLGTWQVTKVYWDQGGIQPWASNENIYNTHKFLGRVFSFTPQRLVTNAPAFSRKDEPCDDPKIITIRTTAIKLISTSIVGRGYHPNGLSPKDFHLPLSNNTPVEVLSLHCKHGVLAEYLGGPRDINEAEYPYKGINGAWLIVLSQKQLALRWHDDVILILERPPENVKPVASFDCAKATTVVEKTICSSAPLAAYDQSVAQTYKFAMEYYKTKKNTTAQIVALKDTQKQWLVQRDTCGSNVACLEKSMGSRINKMDYEVAFYAYKSGNGNPPFPVED